MNKAVTKILFLSDSDNLINAADIHLLEELGYQVTRAQNAEASLALAVLLEPALIILEIPLQDMSCVEVLRDIKSHPTIANMPVIVITAQADAEFKCEVFKSGVADYLSAPNLFDELAAKLNLYARLQALEKKSPHPEQLTESLNNHNKVLSNATAISYPALQHPGLPH